MRLTIEEAHEVARELDMVATTLDSKIRAAKKKPKGATPTPTRDSTRGHDVAGRRAGLDQLPPMWRPTPRGHWGQMFEVVVKSPHAIFAAITFVVGILGLLCPLLMLFRASL